jgi:hypothetical protein
MPFKSKAQRRKFAQLLVEGKISDETYEEWNRSTGRRELPERVTPKVRSKGGKARKTAGTRAKRRAKAIPGSRRKGKARPRRKAK